MATTRLYAPRPYDSLDFGIVGVAPILASGTDVDNTKVAAVQAASVAGGYGTLSTSAGGVVPSPVAEPLRARGPWQANTDYSYGDVVNQAGVLYVAPSSFRSGSSFTVGNWTKLGTYDATDPSLTGTYVSFAGADTISGAKTFTGGVVANRVGVGSGVATNPRQPSDFNVVIDGSTLTASLPTDKVGFVNDVTFLGGFTAEPGFGTADPTFLFGANDFIVTGTTAGDVAGITDIFGRITEVHLRTPSANVTGQIIGASSESNIDSTATGATTPAMISHRVAGPAVNAGTVTTAYSLKVLAPTTSGAGSIGTAYGIYADGQAYFSTGLVTANASLLVNGSSAKFTTNTPNAQGAAAGVYLGNQQGAAIELADGTNTARMDLNTTNLRFLKAGAAVLGSFDFSGNFTAAGGLSITPATTTTAPAAGAAGALPATPAGYMTITVAGTARKVAYY